MNPPTPLFPVEMKKMKLRKPEWNKKGQVAIYFTFLIVALIIILITAVLAPMGVLINTRLYAAGEDIMLRANESIADINNTTVREAVQANIENALDAQENNIEVNANLFQYSWIFILVLVAVVVFLYTRVIVEFRTGGMGGFV